jgi:hypothetical protein
LRRRDAAHADAADSIDTCTGGAPFAFESSTANSMDADACTAASAHFEQRRGWVVETKDELSHRLRLVVFANFQIITIGHVALLAFARLFLLGPYIFKGQTITCWWSRDNPCCDGPRSIFWPNGGFWHFSDIPHALTNVRYRG